MYALTIKPCAQRHEWNLYLNAAMFTSTLVLDEVPFVANGKTTVRAMVDHVRTASGRTQQKKPRRVDGFEENWTKVLYKGQELDQDMKWDDIGLFDDAVDGAQDSSSEENCSSSKKPVVAVVWKEIAAEGYKVATDAMDDVSTDEDEYGDEFDYAY